MKKKHILMIIIAVLLLIALLQLDTTALLASLKRLPVLIIIFLLLLQIGSQCLINYQWFQIGKLSGLPLSFSMLFYINSQGAVMDSITPGVKFGGEVTRAVQISRLGKCKGEEAAAIVALQKLFSISSLFLVLLFVLAYLIRSASLDEGHWLPAPIQYGLYALVALLFLAFLSLFLFPTQLLKYRENKKPSKFSFLRKVTDAMQIFLKNILLIRQKPLPFVGLVFLSLFIWLLYPLKMYLLVIQFAPMVSVVYVTAITFAAYLVAMLPIFPGGLGGFEGTMSGLLFTLSLSIYDASMITIFFRFVTFWFVLLMGLVYIFIQRKKYPTQKQEA